MFQSQICLSFEIIKQRVVTIFYIGCSQPPPLRHVAVAPDIVDFDGGEGTQVAIYTLLPCRLPEVVADFSYDTEHDVQSILRCNHDCPGRKLVYYSTRYPPSNMDFPYLT